MCVDEVRGRLDNGRKHGAGAVQLLEPYAFGQVDGGAIGVAPRQLQQSEHRGGVDFDRVRAGPAGEFEPGDDVRPAIRIVSEDRLYPRQDHERVGRQTALPGLGGELDGLGGCGICGCDLAAPELELGKQGQRKGQDGRGAGRSRRADDAVEHPAGVRHCSINTSNWTMNESSPSGSIDSSHSSIGSSRAKASSTWPLLAVTWARTIVAVGAPPGPAPASARRAISSAPARSPAMTYSFGSPFGSRARTTIMPIWL
jgi:hypothetical protein